MILLLHSSNFLNYDILISLFLYFDNLLGINLSNVGARFIHVQCLLMRNDNAKNVILAFLQREE